ncbi:hypothetical protein JHW43_006027 [Diplocarpon mali]|nr:hypothetical protein JHW43_006027 [Diplocarpon mali]
MPPSQTPSPGSSFLPNFRLRRPPWESRNAAPELTPTTRRAAEEDVQLQPHDIEGPSPSLPMSRELEEEADGENAEMDAGDMQPGEEQEEEEEEQEEEQEEAAVEEALCSLTMPLPEGTRLPPSPPIADDDVDLVAGQIRLLDLLRGRTVEAGRVQREVSHEAVTAAASAARKLTDKIRHQVPMELDNPFDPAALGLKEIGNLASWTVSSSKPGCGVDALRDDDTGLFWQSDGPQPHHLNIHFSRLVCILSIRLFLDFEADESYTPTRIALLAGTGYHDLIPFASLSFEQPKGWIDVPLDHVGGGPDGKTLRAFLVQIKVVENHQNGKDTHVRGLKIYARDDRASRGLGALLGEAPEEVRGETKVRRQGGGMERSWLVEPDWMGEAELR